MKNKIIIDGFNEWQNQPTVTGINRLPSTTSFVPYDSEMKAKKGDKEKSERYFNLCGEWKFNIYDSYRDRDLAFTNPDFDSSEWDTIPVPSSWQSLGYDKHIYSNTSTPGKEFRSPMLPKHLQNITP